MKRKIFEIIQIGDKSNVISRSFDIFIVVAILSNLTVAFLETFEVMAGFFSFFDWVKYSTALVFCIEYVLRIWTADFLYPNKGRLRSRLSFVRSFDGIVDLFTILSVFFLTGFVAFRMIRVVRIFHLFTINGKHSSLTIIKEVLVEKKNQILSSMFVIFLLMLAGSLSMYGAENSVQPEVFKNAFSGLWWCVSAMLTIGYGDIYPITVTGQILAIIIAFLGVGAVAVPTGIISAGFVERYTLEKSSEEKAYDMEKVGKLVIEPEHSFIGRRIGQIEKEYGMQFYMVLREQMAVFPSLDLRIKEGDVLILQSEKCRFVKHMLHHHLKNYREYLLEKPTPVVSWKKYYTYSYVILTVS